VRAGNAEFFGHQSGEMAVDVRPESFLRHG
jgi:hypothetical protein